MISLVTYNKLVPVMCVVTTSYFFSNTAYTKGNLIFARGRKFKPFCINHPHIPNMVFFGPTNIFLLMGDFLCHAEVGKYIKLLKKGLILLYRPIILVTHHIPKKIINFLFVLYPKKFLAITVIFFFPKS